MTRFFYSLLSLLLSLGMAWADWPLFRGNAGQTGVARGALANPLHVRWKVKLQDSIESAAAIVGDTVYVGTLGEYLYALALKDGREKWKYKAGPIKAPASVFQGAVYVGTEEGIFHCLDSQTGKKRWTFEINGEITSGANFLDDRVLFGGWDSTLYCLGPDGKPAWKFKTEGPVNGSPAVAKNLTFLAGCDSQLHMVDVQRGKELAKVDLGGQAGATAAVLGDRLYVGTMSNQFQAVDLKKKEILWTYESKRSQPFYSSAAVTDKLVIVGCRDKAVYALDRIKGTEVWTHATKGHVDSSPVVVDQRAIVGSKDGSLYVLDRDRGTLVQKFDLGRSITASPAVAGNCLIIGTTEGVLYCLGKKEQCPKP